MTARTRGVHEELANTMRYWYRRRWYTRWSSYHILYWLQLPTIEFSIFNVHAQEVDTTNIPSISSPSDSPSTSSPTQDRFTYKARRTLYRTEFVHQDKHTYPHNIHLIENTEYTNFWGWWIRSRLSIQLKWRRWW